MLTLGFNEGWPDGDMLRLSSNGSSLQRRILRLVFKEGCQEGASLRLGMEDNAWEGRALSDKMQTRLGTPSETNH